MHLAASKGITLDRLLQRQVISRPCGPSQDAPLVSVILPTYRLRPGGLNRKAIESVLQQTVRDLELIIVDDGSIDGLGELLAEFLAKDSRVTVIRNEINSGLPAGRVNQGLLIARGRYIGYMFEDDYWLPVALEKMLATMAQADGEAVVYGAVDWQVQKAGGRIEHRTLGDWDFNYALLKNENRLANCAVLHPRSLMDRSGMYDPHILARRASDYDLWLRMGKLAPFLRCKDTVGVAYQGTRESLGNLVQQDLVLTLQYLSSNRNAKLTPDTVLRFEIDNLDGVADGFTRCQIQEQYIIPFYQQHPGLLRPAERKSVLISAEHRNRLLITKGDYSTSVDVTLGNFQDVLGRRVQTSSFIKEASLLIPDRWNFDTLILYRTLADHSLRQIPPARQNGKTVIYWIDDNMFKFGTGYMAEEFADLKPGSEAYCVLEKEVAAADLVVSYSSTITEDCQDHTPRVVELPTNIQQKYIEPSAPIEQAQPRRLKYAILGGPARKNELAQLWQAFAEFAARHKEQIEFHVWGMDPNDFGVMQCPVLSRPFDHSYTNYLSAIAKEKFDFLVCPLFDDHPSKLSKSPIKYLEATCAGAVGIFSDAKAYREVKDGRTGIKVKDDGWLEALEESLKLSDQRRLEIFQAAKEDILQRFTTESQVLKYLSVFEAADLHAALRSHGAPDGQAVVAYFFYEFLLGGCTLHLMQHALMAKTMGFRPILCFAETMHGEPLPVEPQTLQWAKEHGLEIVILDFFSTVWKRDVLPGDLARASKLADWMKSRNVGMVHCVTYAADVAMAADSLNLPVVATLHKHYDAPEDLPELHQSPVPQDYQRMVSAIHSSSHIYCRQWQQQLGAPASCIRAPIAEEYFQQFAARIDRPQPPVPTLLVSGTVQPRKGQLKAIEAITILKDRGLPCNLQLMGYDNLAPSFVQKCKIAIGAAHLEDNVTILGFAANPVEFYRQADYLLCSSDEESMPQTILRSMASGIRVVSTPVGGVCELVMDGFSGIVSNGFEAEDLANAIQRAMETPHKQWRRMLQTAHQTAEMVCSSEVVKYQLLKLYNLAVRENRMIHGMHARADVMKALMAPHLGRQLPVQQPPTQQRQTQAGSAADSNKKVMAVARKAMARQRTGYKAPVLEQFYHEVSQACIVPGDDLPRSGVFVPRCNTLSAITIVIGTHGRDLRGEIAARIIDPRMGVLLQDVSVDLYMIKDGSPVTFCFDEPLESVAGKPLLLQLASNCGWPLAVFEHRAGRLRRMTLKALRAMEILPNADPGRIYVHCHP